MPKTSPGSAVVDDMNDSTVFELLACEDPGGFSPDAGFLALRRWNFDLCALLSKRLPVWLEAGVSVLSACVGIAVNNGFLFTPALSNSSLCVMPLLTLLTLEPRIGSPCDTSLLTRLNLESSRSVTLVKVTLLTLELSFSSLCVNPLLALRPLKPALALKLRIRSLGRCVCERLPERLRQ